MSQKKLPIDTVLPALLEAVSKSPTVVLEAPPGAGKTTRVPPALLEKGPSRGEIWVSEPRRLAARLAARYVAAELKEKVGQTVGYAVRFEDVSSRATRVRYLTGGTLLRRLVAAPELPGVGCVILDEFHERGLDSDVILCLVRQLQSRRPELRLLVMSATLDTTSLRDRLSCPIIKSEGRSYPVQIEHETARDERPLEKRVVSAARALLTTATEPPLGDILVFLPGAREIRACEKALGALAAEHALSVLPLHGDLPLEQQARAIAPAPRHKLVLSTNVAESSVTIDGVTAVIDTGTARVLRHSPFTGLPRLTLEKISQASARQRAGRAGRTRPGRVLRLYTKADLSARPSHDPPEMQRSDLSETLLLLKTLDEKDIGELPWLDPPPEPALSAASQLLTDLGALDAHGQPTAVGKRLTRLPVHPRLGRVLLEAERHGALAAGCLAAALLSERDIRRGQRARFSDLHRGADSSGPSDVLELSELFREAEAADFDASTLRQLDLDRGAVMRVDRARRQLERAFGNVGSDSADPEAVDEAVQKALLSGFIDRVAKRRRPRSRELVLSGGSVAALSDQSVVHEGELMVALDIDQTSDGRVLKKPLVRTASLIDVAWLLQSYDDKLSYIDELAFNPQSERVESVSKIMIGSVTLEESRVPAAPSAEASQLLLKAARDRGLSRFDARGELDSLLGRLDLLSQYEPELSLQAPDQDTAAALLTAACEGKTSFSELEATPLDAQIHSHLSPDQQRALLTDTPEHITLALGRRVKVHYARGKDPFIASRLQDFFSMSETPTLCRGRVPLTLHLLAPNQRAVQVTRDLEGFWQRHYPGLRKQLMRRYPKHAWPEDGKTATSSVRKRR